MYGPASEVVVGIVRLHHGGRIEVIDPGTPGDQVRAEQALMRLVEALARQAARKDFEASVAARKTEEPAINPSSLSST